MATRAELIEACKDLNQLDPPLDPPIPTRAKTTVVQMEKELSSLKEDKIELSESDGLTDATWKVLEEYGVAFRDANREGTTPPTDKEPKNETKPEPVPRTKPSVKEWTEKMVGEGKWTRKQLQEKFPTKFPTNKISVLNTILSDGKNPKYSLFKNKLIKESDEGILSFVEGGNK